MDRVGGAELILPWPPGLPLGPAVSNVRDATAAEHAAAEQIVGPACAAAGLVPIRSYAARPDAPPPLIAGRQGRGTERAQRLIVLIIGRRWVHAGGSPQPGVCWFGGTVERA